MKKSFRILLGFVFFLGLVLLMGCTDEDDNKNEDDSSTTTELEGTWKTGCIQDDPYEGDYDISTFVFSGNMYTYTFDVYEDSNCTTKIAIFAHSGTFQTFDSVSTTDGEAAIQIVLTLENFHITPVSDGIVTFLNQSSTCGATDWEIDVPKDGFGCSDFSLANVSAGDSKKDIYLIDGTTLKLGIDDYPTELNSNKVYTKQ